MSPLSQHENPELPKWNVDHVDIPKFEAAMRAMQWTKISTENTAGDSNGACLRVVWQHNKNSSLKAEAKYTNYANVEQQQVLTAHIVGDYTKVYHWKQKLKVPKKTREIVEYKHKYYKDAKEQFPLDQYIDDLGYGTNYKNTYGKQ